jgi:hypothetical protein
LTRYADASNVRGVKKSSGHRGPQPDTHTERHTETMSNESNNAQDPTITNNTEEVAVSDTDTTTNEEQQPETDSANTEAPDKAYEKPVTNNAVVDGLIDLAISKATLANQYAQTVSSSKGTFAKSIKDYRENSDDTDVAEYRKWEEAVYAELNKRRGAIDKAIASRLGGESISPETLNEAEEQYKETAKDAKEAWKAARSTAKMFGVTLEGEGPALLTLAGNQSNVSGPKNSTGRRFWFDDVTVDGQSVGSLSKAALLITQKSKVRTTASDLQTTMIEDAKSDDYAVLNDHTFEYSVTKDGQTFRFDVTTFKSQDEDKPADDKASDTNAADDNATDEAAPEVNITE